jgi:hypothetical protein
MSESAVAEYVEVRVVIETSWLVPVHQDGETTDINGWSLDEVLREWFEDPRYPPDRHHATRDSYAVGGRSRFVSSEIVDRHPATVEI